MTDQIINSNQSSVILRTLADAETMDLSYEIAPSYPLLAKQYREITANGGAVNQSMNGQEIAFNITKSMLLRDLMIKTTFTTTTTTIDNKQYVGLNMFEWIQLRTNNKVILTISDAYIQARTEHSPEYLKNGIYRRALCLTATTEVLNATSTAASCTYTPVFSSFFDDIRNAFDLNFYEQLSLNCKFNTTVKAGIVPTTLTIGTPTLWVWTYRPDDKYYDLLRSKNQNPSRPLNMLCINTFTERQVCTSTTANTMRLNVNYPVIRTYVMVRPVVASLKGQCAKIDSVDFYVGGTKLLESVPHCVANWESSKFGASGSKLLTIGTNDNNGTFAAGTFGFDDSRCICFDWSLKPHDRLSCSGAISFSQINYPQITVNTQSLSTASNYEICVVHEYWNIISCDSSNGSVNISVSN